MKGDVKVKILVLALSFLLFATGVASLSMAHSPLRTLLLLFVIIAMFTLAVLLTFRNMKRKKR